MPTATKTVTAPETTESVAVTTSTLKERVQWALRPPKHSLVETVERTAEHTVKNLRELAKQNETEWGNRILNQLNPNKMWTTKLGEELVRDVLQLLGETPRKPKTINHYSPDWETDKYIYEVKTRNWTTSGTAGEKVFGVPYKYSDVPLDYGKPLRIVCVGYQEHELSEGNTRIFHPTSQRKQQMLKLWKELDIEFVKFSDLVAPVLEQIMTGATEKTLGGCRPPVKPPGV